MVSLGGSRAPDIATLRAETPGTSRLAHFNNAGASLVPRRVSDGVRRFLDAEETLGGYEAVEAHADLLERPYSACASLLNCGAEEIAVVQSATQAWQQVFFGIEFQEGDRLITSTAEYGSNYIAYLQAKKRHNISIEVVKETPEGDLDLDHLRELAAGSKKPKLISISHIPTSSGRVYDAIGVGAIAKEFGIPYLLDACQSVGQMPVDVEEIGCDFLTATSRKYLRGPRGAGLLYISKHVLDSFEPMTLDVRGAKWSEREEFQMASDAKRFEQYEMSFAAKAGFGIAVEYALEVGLDWCWERIQFLSKKLREGLSGIDKVQVLDKGRVLCGIVSFCVDGMDPEVVKAALRQQSINVSVSLISSSRIDFENRNLKGVVRASVHYYNTEEEVERLVQAVSELSMQ
ncbi:hypothetical protein BSKO_01932 [Bryopsis sp. KO-2023]|nr:hypothetical protein BSKO_01932 [Bryopsis sp. KO-2023]